MTKVALIADCHVANHRRWGGETVGGVNVRGWECVEVIRAAAKVAGTHRCSALFVLGDLFDSTRPTPPLVAATIAALRSGYQGMPVHVLVGNHDRQSMHDNDQACAPMNYVDGIHVRTEPYMLKLGHDFEACLLPYMAGEAKDWVAAGMALMPAHDSSRRRIALTHCGIWDDLTPSYMKGAHDAVGLGHVRWLSETHGVDFFAAGNWHEAQSWKPRPGTKDPVVLIPGTACPHNFSDPPEHGAVTIYDSAVNQWTRIPLSTPLFIKVPLHERYLSTEPAAEDDLRAALEAHYSGYEPARAYVRLSVRKGEVEQAMEQRDLILKTWPRTVVTVEVATAEAEGDIKLSARMALQASNAEDLVETYADLSAVEEPGTREGVVRRLGEYRKAAC